MRKLLAGEEDDRICPVARRAFIAPPTVTTLGLSWRMGSRMRCSRLVSARRTKCGVLVLKERRGSGRVEKMMEAKEKNE